MGSLEYASSYWKNRPNADWGPEAWNYMHCALHKLPDKVPDNDQLCLVEMFDTLPTVVPCADCADEIQKHMDKNPIDAHVTTQKGVESWLFNMHNAVNQKLGYPTMPAFWAKKELDRKCGICEPLLVLHWQRLGPSDTPRVACRKLACDFL